MVAAGKVVAAVESTAVAAVVGIVAASVAAGKAVADVPAEHID